MNESEWLQQAVASGDPHIFDALIDRYYLAVVRLAVSIVNDTAVAEDMAQETFVAAGRKLHQYRGDAAPKTWLFSIAVNVCRAHLRRQRRRQALATAWEVVQRLFASSEATPEQQLLRDERDAALWTAVDTLDDKHRLPVLLRYVHGLSAPEIGQILQISPGTVYSRLHYAHQKLKAHLLLENRLASSLAQERDP